MGSSCSKCNGFIGETGKFYGYAGKWCYCNVSDNFNPNIVGYQKAQKNIIQDMLETLNGVSSLDRGFNVKRITQIKVKKTDESASIPKYAHSGDSGFDFASIESVTISPGETKLIGTGLSFEIPVGFELQVRPRSGMSAKTKFRVANSPGTIDSNFRGEVKIIAENTGHRPIFIEKGDRIAQGVICPVYQAVFVEEELEDTERGNNAFGSSGVK